MFIADLKNFYEKYFIHYYIIKLKRHSEITL